MKHEMDSTVNVIFSTQENDRDAYTSLGFFAYLSRRMLFTQAMKICIMFIAAFFFLTQTGAAQSQSPIEVSVDRTSISEDSYVTLRLTVNAADRPRVNLPTMDEFTTIRTSRGDQMTITNGVVSQRYIYDYWLRPVSAGQLTIDPIEVVVDGQSYSTDPITIDVVGGSGQPAAPGQQGSGAEQAPTADFFVEAEVDNPNPYLGEQVIYTHRLFTAFNVSQPSYDFPRFTGFWAEDEPLVTQRTGQRDGRRFSVRETRIVLFPTRVGPLQIDETVITARSGLFSSGFVLQTEPINLEVKSLPEDAPPDFNGAVGLFTLESEVSNNLAKVDEPITLLAVLTGQGNISAAPDPEWPDMPEWRVFDAQANTFTDFRSGKLIGRRVYERLMVPGAAGSFTIPPITYTYFDPDAGEYRSVSSAPVNLTVEPGSGEAPPPVVIGANKEEIERIGSDIRHIKPVSPAIARASTPLTSQTSYWLAWGVPVLLLGLNYVWSRRQLYLKRNVGQARSARAYKVARKSLSEARRGNNDRYIASGQILTSYLADKLNQPVVGLTQDSLADLLKSKGLDPVLLEQVHDCLAESDMGRFGPGGSTPGHSDRLLDRTEELIGYLEKTLTS